MRQVIAAITILLLPLTPPDKPHVSCIDGHVVENLSDCPQITQHRVNQQVPLGGGGRSGLLGLGIGGIL